MANLVEHHSNVVSLIGDTPTAALTVSTRGLMALLSCGKPTAIKVGTAAQAKIVVGRRILWNVQAVQRYLNIAAE